MTRTERLEVAQRIVAVGGRAVDISRALRMNGTRARWLYNLALQHVTPPAAVAVPCSAAMHGDANAYRNHGCRCESARLDNTRYNKLRVAGLIESGWVSSVGLLRRRQALGRLGYGWVEMSAFYGCHENVLRGHLSRPSVRRVTFRRWVEMFDALSQNPGPNDKARAYAQRMGWPPAAAWDDIDDPRERPKGVRKIVKHRGRMRETSASAGLPSTCKEVA